MEKESLWLYDSLCRESTILGFKNKDCNFGLDVRDHIEKLNEAVENFKKSLKFSEPDFYI